MQLRNKSSLFWHFAFPVIFMVIFGLIFGSGDSVNINIGLASSNKQMTTAFEQAFENNKAITVKKGSKGKMLDKLKNGDLDTVVYIGKTSIGKPTSVTYYYDPADSTTGSVTEGIVSSVFDNIAKKASKAPEMFKVNKKSVSSKDLGFIGFLLPGILGMSIMFSSIFGTATPLVTEREKGILRRLRLTLMKPGTYIAARSITMVIIAFLQAVIIIVVGIMFFNIEIIGNPLTILLVIMLGALMMVFLGFFVAGLSTKSESVDAIANAIAMPMMFLAGTFFPIDGAPSWLKSIAALLPLTYLNDSLRDIMIKGKAIGDISFEIGIMLLWIAILLALAIVFFKWETPQKSS